MKPVVFLVVALVLGSVSLAAEPRVIDLALRGGQLPKDQRVIRVRQGDEVVLLSLIHI